MLVRLGLPRRHPPDQGEDVSPTRFEKVNGHVPTVFPQEGKGFRAVCACDCNGGLPVVLSASAATEKKALKLLLEEVYRRHSEIVMLRQGWKCSQCGLIKGLQSHHIVARSKGRNDRISNLRGDCCSCHEMETNPR